MARIMNAVQVVAYGQPLRYGRCSIPRTGEGEVLVAVRASGLCRSDARLVQGRQDLGHLPRVIGHEIAGKIVETGPGVRGWSVGQRVIVMVDVVCHRCRHCLTGQTQRCPHKQRIGFERDGGHAEFVAAPAENLVEMPAGLGYEEAAILSDAAGTMYHALLHRGQLGINQRAVILGVGALGIHGVQIARLAGAEVIATSRRSHRLEAARRYGAVPVNPEAEDLAGAVAELTQGAGADVVADCIGTRESIRQGLSLLRPGGKLLVIAYHDEEFAIPSIPLFALEREILGCRGCTQQELQEVIGLVSRGRLEPVIGARYPLAQVQEALGCLESGDVVGRIVLTRSAWN